MRRLLIVGATSAIAEATAREFAKRGDALFLVGRSLPRLQALAQDLKIRGAGPLGVYELDVCDLPRFGPMLDEATRTLGGLDHALIAHGTLSDQADCERSIEALLRELQVNAVSVLVLCTHLANRFAAQKGGVIAVISSVAGDRGRQSNYVYGTAKAAVTAFTSGMRQRLAKQGVRVVTIKPGFVDTPMTAAFKKGPAWATPARIARDITRAMIDGRSVVYTPSFWRPIMWVIRSIPEFLFERLSL
jgi:NAD(P)-dependent dehydrogenase (short-subunit alcohol dehydrogenase family)